MTNQILYNKLSGRIGNISIIGIGFTNPDTNLYNRFDINSFLSLNKDSTFNDFYSQIITQFIFRDGGDINDLNQMYKVEVQIRSSYNDSFKIKY
jgi:hypothetical protein